MATENTQGFKRIDQKANYIEDIKRTVSCAVKEASKTSADDLFSILKKNNWIIDKENSVTISVLADAIVVEIF